VKVIPNRRIQPTVQQRREATLVSSADAYHGERLLFEFATGWFGSRLCENT